MRRPLIVLLFAVAVVLAACGGDDSNEGTNTPAQSANVPEDSSKSSTATEDKNSKNGEKGENDRKASRSERRSRRAEARRERGTQRERNRARRQRSRQKALSAPPRSRAPKPGSKPTRDQKAPPPTDKGAQPELPKTDDATFKAAKLVCGGLYEAALRGKTKDEVAKDYARPWPKDRQDAAYKGCLEGLQLPRPNEDDEADY